MRKVAYPLRKNDPEIGDTLSGELCIPMYPGILSNGKIRFLCESIGRKFMSIDQIVLAVAGGMVILSAVLAWLVSPMWLLLTAFVGINLVQSAFTGFCPMAIILKKIGVTPGQAFS